MPLRPLARVSSACVAMVPWRSMRYQAKTKVKARNKPVKVTTSLARRPKVLMIPPDPWVKEYLRAWRPPR